MPAGTGGLYFVGLTFLHALSSSMVQGVGRDAKRVIAHLLATVAPVSDRPLDTAAST